MPLDITRSSSQQLDYKMTERDFIISSDFLYHSIRMNHFFNTTTDCTTAVAVYICQFINECTLSQWREDVLGLPITYEQVFIIQKDSLLSPSCRTPNPAFYGRFPGQVSCHLSSYRSELDFHFITCKVIRLRKIMETCRKTHLAYQYLHHSMHETSKLKLLHVMLLLPQSYYHYAVAFS